LAIITEGLLGYLPGDQVDGLWRRFAATLAGFQAGFYLSDLHVGAVRPSRLAPSGWCSRPLCEGRSICTGTRRRRRREALLAAGFRAAELHRAAALAPETRGPGAGMAHIIEASTA